MNLGSTHTTSKEQKEVIWPDAVVSVAKISLLVCLLPLALFLTYYAIRDCSFDEDTILFQDNILIHAAIFMAVAAVLLGIQFFLNRKPDWQAFFGSKRFGDIVLAVSSLFMLIAGFLYVSDHPYYPMGDQINIAQGAVFVRSDNYTMFARGGYIALYEQQKGILFLYEILFSLFGDFNFAAIARLHVLTNTATLIFGNLFIREVSGKTLCRNLYCLLMLLCLPFFFYLPFAYGDLPSTALAVMMFWALVKFGKSLKIRYVVIAAVSAAVALMFRTNTWIVLIAASIGLIVSAFQKRSFKPVIAMLCILLASGGSIRCIDKMYEIRSGMESGIGLPSILWVAMGLQETDGTPGRFNRYQQDVYEECGMDRKAAGKVAGEYIKNRIGEFLDDPAMARDFFLEKLLVQWVEPMYGALFHTGTAQKEDMNWPYTELYYGEFSNVIRQFSNYYQSVIYLSFLIYVILQACRTVRRSLSGDTMAAWIPGITVLGGFLFSIMWECSERYMLAYYVFMLPYAAMGLGEAAVMLFEAQCRFARRRRGASS